MPIQNQTEASKDLWAAVLFQAMQDLIKPKGKPRDKMRFRDSALAWFNNRTDDGLNSFLGICDNLKMDPDKTRAAILSREAGGQTWMDIKTAAPADGRPRRARTAAALRANVPSSYLPFADFVAGVIK